MYHHLHVTSEAPSARKLPDWRWPVDVASTRQPDAIGVAELPTDFFAIIKNHDLLLLLLPFRYFDIGRSSLINAVAATRESQTVENQLSPTKFMRELLRPAERDRSRQENVSAAQADARNFLSLLPDHVPKPTTVHLDDPDEVELRWKRGDREAVVSFEGRGCFGYAFKKNTRFTPGAFAADLTANPFPQDLADYLVALNDE